MKNKILITIPKSWNELSDTQLYYIYGLLSDNLSSVQIKTYCLFSWGGIKIKSKYDNGYLIKQNKIEAFVTSSIIENAIHSLDWIDALPLYPVRISAIKNKKALNQFFQGVALEKFIYCDNLYQGFLEKQNSNFLDKIGCILYSAEIKFNQSEKISIFYWFASVKAYFAKTFPNFFRPVSENYSNMIETSSNKKLQESMNAQIRALTKGDITKEKEVLKMDVWRAFAELDAQAKEYSEMKNKYGKSL